MVGPPLTGVKKAARSAIFTLFVNGAVQKGMVGDPQDEVVEG
jgi:hypothetical protein